MGFNSGFKELKRRSETWLRLIVDNTTFRRVHNCIKLKDKFVLCKKQASIFLTLGTRYSSQLYIPVFSPPGNNTCYAYNGNLGRHKIRSRRFGKRMILELRPRSNYESSCGWVSTSTHCTDYTVLAPDMYYLYLEFYFTQLIPKIRRYWWGESMVSSYKREVSDPSTAAEEMLIVMHNWIH